ncbi:MAG: restriction endonuclease subunit S [Defluviitaleaceae bacterium]|nr:restriction endonuclease subunit S [Defluviitaleaceae bacterium]
MNKTTPELRCVGFNGAWKKINLKDISTIVNRKYNGDINIPIMMISASTGFIEQSEKYSSYNAGESLRKYTLLYKGELSYNHGYSKFRNFGSCFILDVEKALIPFVYHSFSIINDNPSFFAIYLNSGIFDGELKKRVSSSARMDGLLNISFQSYMNLEIHKPSLSEQTAIATTFQNLDRTITIKKEQHEKTKNIKKALLTKMFPQNGAKVPEVRCVGFSGEWESRRLEEIFDIIAGGDVPKESFSINPTEKYKVEILSNGIENKSLYGYTEYSKVLQPSLTISARGTIGWTNYVDKPFFPIVRLLVITPKAKLNLRYCYFYMKTIENDYEVSESGIPQLTKPMLKDITILLPTLKEQTAIATTLQNLDNLLQVQTTELYKLENIKKALLAKMFV